MKAKEIRDLSNDELEKKESDLREELFRLRLRNATRQLENNARLGQIKKDIARLETIKTERRKLKT